MVVVVPGQVVIVAGVVGPVVVAPPRGVGRPRVPSAAAAAEERVGAGPVQWARGQGERARVGAERVAGPVRPEVLGQAPAGPPPPGLPPPDRLTPRGREVRQGQVAAPPAPAAPAARPVSPPGPGRRRGEV